jgi:hypothetical protein
MSRQQGRIQAQPPFRQAVGGMVAQKQQPAVSVPGNGFKDIFRHGTVILESLAPGTSVRLTARLFQAKPDSQCVA